MKVNLINELNSIFKGYYLISVDGMEINKEIKSVSIVKHGNFKGLAFKFIGEKTVTVFPLTCFTNFDFDMDLR